MVLRSRDTQNNGQCSVCTLCTDCDSYHIFWQGWNNSSCTFPAREDEEWTYSVFWVKLIWSIPRCFFIICQTLVFLFITKLTGSSITKTLDVGWGEQYISCIELENRFPVYIRQQKAIPSVMISCMNTFGENRLLVYIRLQNAISSVIISCMNTFGEKIQYFFHLLIVFSSIEFIGVKYGMLPTCVSMGMIGSSNIESFEGELFSSASKYCRYRAFIKIILIRL